MKPVQFKNWHTEEIYIGNGKRIVHYDFRKRDGNVVSDYDLHHNIFCLDADDEIIWQVTHKYGVDPFYRIFFLCMWLEDSKGNIVEQFHWEKDLRMMGSSETSIPWQRLDFSIDIETGYATCIRDTHGQEAN